MYSDSSIVYKLYKKKLCPEAVYLFYNIFVRNFKHYFLLNERIAQSGEEKEIRKLLSIKKKGKFIDIGCFHPTRQNNTYELYKHGWRGINIDLNSLSIKLFKFARPRDINICTAISEKKTTKQLYFLGDLDTKNTIDSNHVNYLRKYFNVKKFEKKKIKTETINNIINKYNFSSFDFFNIDVEGHEYEIIKSFDFKKYKPKLICIEILNHNKAAIKRNKKTINILKKNGFNYISTIGYNQFFLKKNK